MSARSEENCRILLLSVYFFAPRPVCIISLAVKPKYNFYKKINMQKVACGSKYFDALIEFKRFLIPFYEYEESVVSIWS